MGAKLIFGFGLATALIIILLISVPVYFIKYGMETSPLTNETINRIFDDLGQSETLFTVIPNMCPDNSSEPMLNLKMLLKLPSCRALCLLLTWCKALVTESNNGSAIYNCKFYNASGVYSSCSKKYVHLKKLT